MDTDPTIPVPKSNNYIIIILVLIIVCLSVLIGILIAQNQILHKQIDNLTLNLTITPTPTLDTNDPQLTDQITSTPEQSFITYTNTKNGFSIQYPAGWRVVGGTKLNEMVGFGPSDMPEDVAWSINFYSPTEQEQLIAQIGKQFPQTRKEQRFNFTLAGLPAIMVTVTTSEVPNWISKQIFITNETKLIVISNGAQDNPLFDHFYQSFTTL